MQISDINDVTRAFGPVALIPPQCHFHEIYVEIQLAEAEYLPGVYIVQSYGSSWYRINQARKDRLGEIREVFSKTKIDNICSLPK